MPEQRAISAIPRLQELNPRVNIQPGPTLVSLMSADPTFYTAYNLVIACDLDFLTLTLINAAVRLGARPFYAAGIHGEFGFIFADLVNHDFITERESSSKPAKAGEQETVTRTIVDAAIQKQASGPAKEIITKREIYCPLILANSSPLEPSILTNRRRLRNVPALLPALRALFDFQRLYGRLPDYTSSIDLGLFTQAAKEHAEQLLLPATTLTGDFLKTFILAIGTELPPTASFIGSRLSEDAINVITHKDQPIQNFALFDGEVGPIYSLYSTPPEPPSSMPLANGNSNGTTVLSDGVHLDAPGVVPAASSTASNGNVAQPTPPVGNGTLPPGSTTNGGDNATVDATVTTSE